MTFSEAMRQSAEEGIVLLRNEKATLPLSAEDTVAVFGRMQFDYYRSGTGSGGSVHVPYITNITDELLALSREKDMPKVDEELSATYREWLKDKPFDNGGGAWAAEPFCQQDMEISSALAEKAAGHDSKAIYVIGRNAGEDKDYVDEEGSWRLTEKERQNLKTICAVFDKVAVLFNTSGIMDMSWLDDEDFQGHITAAACVWEGGQEGGRAVANMLTGKAVPSGKLTDTIARSIDDYPSTANFGDQKRNIYIEDIYVGYRYFLTFAKDRILFPFGYGLSYTTFAVDKVSATSNGGTISVSATVTNTGSSFSGKETVQVYCTAPQGRLGKPDRVLAGFAKTAALRPGESEKVTVTFPVASLASYDDSGATGNAYCYVLEAGDYRFAVGTDSLSASPVEIDGKPCLHLDNIRVVEKLRQCAAPVETFKRLKPQQKENSYEKAYEDVPLRKVDMAQRIKENLPPTLSYTGNKGISFDDLKKDISKLDAFVAQLSVAELAAMVRGEGMMSHKVTEGIAAAYGGITDALHSYGIPCAGCSDGPSGIRLDTGKEANLVPIGTQLACTWNVKLIGELYTFVGQDLASHKIDALLGPGMNIHRNPLNGRNFEYFSEDPLLSGKMAAAEVAAMQKGGADGTIKHFALNSQEAGRRSCNAVVSERAIREIYLKGFEIAVREGGANSLMTSYNPINGYQAASNYDIVNIILHKEWGFDGLVMTDWWADMNDCVAGGKASVRNTAAMVRARNNVYMVVDNDGAETNLYKDNTEAAIKDGSLSLGELQLCAKDIIKFLLWAPVSKRPLRALKEFLSFTPVLKAAPAGKKLVADGEKFLCADGESVILQVEKDTMYDINGCYVKGGDTLSQSVCNILIDGSPAASFECRSTAGRESFVNAAQVHLAPGFYELTLVHTKPGIEVKFVAVTSEHLSPVASGHFE